MHSGHVHHPKRAALSMITAMACIGLVDNYVALIAQDLSLWAFQFLRAVMALPMLACAVWLGQGSLQSLRPLRLWAVVVRNGLIALGMLFYFASLAYLPITEALAGLFTAPIFVLLISVFVFGEKVGALRVAAVAMGFGGLLLVLWARAGTGTDAGTGGGGAGLGFAAVLPVFGGFFYAAGSVATQRICAGESTFSMLGALFFLQGLIGGTVLLVLTWNGAEAPDGAAGFLVRGWVWPTSLSWTLVFVQAAGSLIGVGFLIRAYQSAEPSFAAVFEYSVFIFGPFFAFILFGQTLTAVQIAGIILIAAAGSLIALRGARAE